MFHNFNEKMSKLCHAVNGKKVILWGWGMSGKFIYLYFKGLNRKIECVIDDGFKTELDILGVKSHHALEYYDPETTVILVTPYKGADDIKILCREYGFYDVILIRRLFYENEPFRELDYYPWIEYEYGLNLVQGRTIEEAEPGAEGCKTEEFHDYWPGKGIVLESVLSNFMFDEKDAVFDFGCGKGASFFMFAKAGVLRGGIEFDRNLYDLAVENTDKLNRVMGSRFSVSCGDAATYTDIDEYNYFYMFDPFDGECFATVIGNIEDSYRRRLRKIVLIYMAPTCHKQVLEHGMFKFSYQVKSLFTVTKTANIYVLE